MHVTVDANTLKLALKRLQPSRRYKSMQEPMVTATAGGSAMILVGTLDSSASVAAVVHDAGTVEIPLALAIKLLGTYTKGSSVVVRSDPGAIFFDKMSFNSIGEN